MTIYVNEKLILFILNKITNDEKKNTLNMTSMLENVDVCPKFFN